MKKDNVVTDVSLHESLHDSSEVMEGIMGKGQKTQGPPRKYQIFLPDSPPLYRPSKKNYVRDNPACWWHCRDDFSQVFLGEVTICQ